MGKDTFDASAGLAFNLSLFERYRKNGQLQAEVHHIPGIRGHYRAYVHLVEGKVVSCTIEDKKGERQRITQEALIRADTARGPFEWKFMAVPAPPSTHPHAHISKPSTHIAPVPRIVAPLDLTMLAGWTEQQKLWLSKVYQTIDGQRNIEHIKKRVSLPPNVVEEALRILLTLKVIVIVSH
jgi:hypothetical protein